MTHIIRYHLWGFEEFVHGASPEKVELEYSDAVLQSNAQVAHELEITKQEINDECGVDLGQHGVFRVADEGLDLQILLDEAEEDLDLPAFFVDVGDGLGRQLKMVGEKDVALAGGGVPIGDAAQGNEAFLGLGAGQPDGLVGEQALVFIDFMVF